jgi:hypothetical protein
VIVDHRDDHEKNNDHDEKHDDHDEKNNDDSHEVIAGIGD